MAEQQIKSRQRVRDFGEVFTSPREVNAMLDLVKPETERIDSRFLEPACGEGAFLTEILRRKLAAVKSRYGKSPYDYERYAVVAVTSIYGIELLPDNAAACREKLFAIWDEEYTANMKSEASDVCREAVRFVLQKNIICGDSRFMHLADGSPIVFSEWSLITGTKIKRRDFELQNLIDDHSEQMSLDTLGWEYPGENAVFIPAPDGEYPPTD